MSEAGSMQPVERRSSLLVTVLAFALPVLFVLVPLVIFLGYSFFSVDQGTIVYGLSLGNYVRFFTDPIFLPVFWNTIVLCVSVAIICILTLRGISLDGTRVHAERKGTDADA